MSETYSILYSAEGDIFFTEHAIDWCWLIPRRWTTSDKEVGSGWYPKEGLDNTAYLALLKHFGLEDYTDEFPLEKVISMSPAELAACRREKELILGLGFKEIFSHRMGDHRPAEVFD